MSNQPLNVIEKAKEFFKDKTTESNIFYKDEAFKGNYRLPWQHSDEEYDQRSMGERLYCGWSSVIPFGPLQYLCSIKPSVASLDGYNHIFTSFLYDDQVILNKKHIYDFDTETSDFMVGLAPENLHDDIRKQVADMWDNKAEEMYYNYTLKNFLYADDVWMPKKVYDMHVKACKEYTRLAMEYGCDVDMKKLDPSDQKESWKLIKKLAKHLPGGEEEAYFYYLYGEPTFFTEKEHIKNYIGDRTNFSDCYGNYSIDCLLAASKRISHLDRFKLKVDAAKRAKMLLKQKGQPVPKMFDYIDELDVGMFEKAAEDYIEHLKNK